MLETKKKVNACNEKRRETLEIAYENARGYE